MAFVYNMYDEKNTHSEIRYCRSRRNINGSYSGYQKISSFIIYLFIFGLQ